MYLPKKATSRGHPEFGYEIDPNDRGRWLPIPAHLDCLNECLRLIVEGKMSYGEASNRITAITGKYLSKVGIRSKVMKLKESGVEVTLKRPPKEPKKAVNAQEKALQNAKKRAADAKRKLAHANKKITAIEKVQPVLKNEGGAVVQTDEIEVLPEAAQEAVLDDEKVLFRPNPGPQEEFLASDEREVLYGGAAGGGKSYALIVDALRYCGHPAFRAIIFRRTNDELRELIWKSKELYPLAFKGAKWSEQKSTWTFPSGASIWFTYLDRDEDVLRYQGQAFTYVGFDELTQWPTPFSWDYMRSRLRTTSDLPLYMRGTTNPGGPGTSWVRKMFVDPAPWGQPFPALDLETGRVLTWPKDHAKHGEPLFYRRFIPARLYDNPHLTRSSDYEANLLALPESQRRQLLEGDWDVADGAAFPEFRRSIHVVQPFEIPSGWTRFRAADWGFSSPACCLWFAVDYDNVVYVYRELYGKGRTADVFADKVTELEVGERIRYGVLDSSTWNNRGDTGPSIAETMIKRGCSWRPADRSPKSRVNSKLEVHRRLQVNPETNKPGLIIFSNCVNLIRTLPIIPLDKNNSEDVDTDAEDHAYDALRYGLMSRPYNPYRSTEEFSFESSKAPETYTPADPVFGY